MIIDHNFVPPNNLEISYVGKDGGRELETFHFEPYRWKKKGARARKFHPEYRNWDGAKVHKKKTKYPSRHTIWEFINSIKGSHPHIFEPNMPNIHFCDIEVMSDDGFPEPEDAKHPVVSIAVHNQEGNCFVLGLKELSTPQCNQMEKEINEHFEKFGEDITFSYKQFDSEKEMMAFFFYKIMPKIVLLTGWNFVYFDWQYLYRRAKKLSIDLDQSSISKEMHYTGRKGFSEPVHTYIPDYQELFSTYDYSIPIKENEKLDWVSEQVLGLKKLSYNGSLQQLYRRDFVKFIKYNAIDTILVKYIHDKLDCLTIHNLLSVISGGIKLKDAASPVAMTEATILPDLMSEHKYLFAESDDGGNKRSSYEGGWVKEVDKGKYFAVACFDFSSLYPSLIRMFNISPDSYLGNISAHDDTHFEHLREGGLVQFDPEKHIRTVNGSVYKKLEDSVLRKKIAEYYGMRKKFQANMYVAEGNLDRLKKARKERVAA